VLPAGSVSWLAASAVVTFPGPVVERREPQWSDFWVLTMPEAAATRTSTTTSAAYSGGTARDFGGRRKTNTCHPLPRSCVGGEDISVVVVEAGSPCVRTGCASSRHDGDDIVNRSRPNEAPADCGFLYSVEC
jgi:hypothetical protein